MSQDLGISPRACYEESAPPADAIAKMEQRIAFHEKRSAELENELKLQRKAATDALARAAQSEQQLKKQVKKRGKAMGKVRRRTRRGSEVEEGTHIHKSTHTQVFERNPVQ